MKFIQIDQTDCSILINSESITHIIESSDGSTIYFKGSDKAITVDISSAQIVNACEGQIISTLKSDIDSAKRPAKRSPKVPSEELGFDDL